jgi:hypothetical protein
VVCTGTFELHEVKTDSGTLLGRWEREGCTETAGYSLFAFGSDLMRAEGGGKMVLMLWVTCGRDAVEAVYSRSNVGAVTRLVVWWHVSADALRGSGSTCGHKVAMTGSTVPCCCATDWIGTCSTGQEVGVSLVGEME